jgi:hypothetical protein
VEEERGRISKAAEVEEKMMPEVLRRYLVRIPGRSEALSRPVACVAINNTGNIKYDSLPKQPQFSPY